MPDLEKNNISKEDIWENILSEEENLIRHVFSLLNEEEKGTVISHLKKMAKEAGWHPFQIRSSQFALTILDKEIRKTNE